MFIAILTGKDTSFVERLNARYLRATLIVRWSSVVRSLLFTRRLLTSWNSFGNNCRLSVDRKQEVCEKTNLSATCTYVPVIASQSPRWADVDVSVFINFYRGVRCFFNYEPGILIENTRVPLLLLRNIGATSLHFTSLDFPCFELIKYISFNARATVKRVSR